MAKGIVARKARDEYVSGYVSEGLYLDTSDCHVQQHQADECDINKIMARYERDGVLEHVKQFHGEYGDFTEVQDYATSLRQVIQAEECFMSLPAEIRKKFDNDPGQFLDFVTNPANRDEMGKMGLLEAPEGVPVGTPISDAKSSKDDAETAA